jgi:hypothetical protein
MAQEAMIRHQIDGLETLIDEAEKGTLFPKDLLLVSVDEATIRALVLLALPREEVIAGRYRVRLDKADVGLRDKWGSVRLDGRVSLASGSPNDVFAELALFGQLATVDIDESGVLKGRVSVIGFEVRRFGLYGESAAGRRLLEGLAEQQAGALSSLAFPITIPVQLQQLVTLNGLGPEGGPVRVLPAQFPLKVTVAEVSAHGGRLWITLDVKAGSWTRVPPPTPAPALPEARP